MIRNLEITENRKYFLYTELPLNSGSLYYFSDVIAFSILKYRTNLLYKSDILTAFSGHQESFGREG